MARNEKTSKRIAAIAARGLRAPSTLTCAEIKALAASALTQAADHVRQCRWCLQEFEVGPGKKRNRKAEFCTQQHKVAFMNKRAHIARKRRKAR